ncbi:glutamine amidotransferase [Chrysiogenes arsenatis]|uniref:glutamine amidotransferase n=1 Tax=Chrysiogenes arsenatis TaxID=309797 RepID=UPI000414C0C0|nr:glutamine amidotransferase [Chrysiogenes arsenatis]
MRALYLLKVGTTFAPTLQQFGDFDHWTCEGLRVNGVPTVVVDAEHGANLPAPEQCAGVVITGSHAMVTDALPWSEAIAHWLPSIVQARIPVLGICYGHQLLAHAMGGIAGYHPAGQEIGTVAISRLPAATSDPLFCHAPLTFLGHTTHSQTVLKLPANAVALAANAHDPHHAFCLGGTAWGVQFHPEYSAAIMRSYIEQQEPALLARGVNVTQLLAEVRETPEATDLLARFGAFVSAGQ